MMNVQIRFKSAGELTSERLKSIYAIWMELADSRLAPARADIAPAKFRALLPWTWMVDVIDDGQDFRFRIAGDRVIQYLGQRYSGTLLSEARGPRFFENMRDIFALCVAQKTPVAQGPLQSSLESRQYLDGEVIVLPLSDDGEAVTHLFGGFDFWPAEKK
jgi:hypothetical protein